MWQVIVLFALILNFDRLELKKIYMDVFFVKKIIISCLLLALSCIAHSANQTKKIARVGCHINSNVCFVYVEGIINTSCPVNDGSFRWDGTSDTNGKAALSILLSAHAANKSVIFGEMGCFSNFPTFSYLMIDNN